MGCALVLATVIGIGIVTTPVRRFCAGSFGPVKAVHDEGTTLVISTHDADLACEWANEAWVLHDGCVAAQGPIGQVMLDRATLNRAHLKMPWIVEVGLEIRNTYPELAANPLPATEAALIQLIHRIRVATTI